jgi:outer membrane protein TolC
VHPQGESDERSAAARAGKPFAQSVDSPQLPQLPQNPTPDQLVQYALLSNADLQQRYWEWRAAIEQIPQAGTQTTTLNIALGTTLTRGRADLGSTTIALTNDPMTDIQWPGKLDAAAQQSLETARAAGRRFRKAQFELRAEVLNAYYDYALTAQLITLEQSNQQLLQTMLRVTQSQSRAASANQQDVLKAANELDLSINDIATIQSQLPAQLAAINAILNRPSATPISPPPQLPPPKLQYSDAELFTLAAHQNPELGALADDIQARQAAIHLAQLQFIPDFNLSVGTDLLGITQSILGQATIPLFRYEALNAAIAQSQANLKAAESARRQTMNDLCAQMVLDLTTYYDTARQLALLENTIIPRTQREVELLRTSYESSRSTLLDLLESQRSLISLERLTANLRITQSKLLADIESITAAPIAGNEKVDPVPGLESEAK